eukprot:gene28070-36959_t
MSNRAMCFSAVAIPADKTISPAEYDLQVGPFEQYMPTVVRDVEVGYYDALFPERFGRFVVEISLFSSSPPTNFVPCRPATSFATSWLCVHIFNGI